MSLNYSRMQLSSWNNEKSCITRILYLCFNFYCSIFKYCEFHRAEPKKKKNRIYFNEKKNRCSRAEELGMEVVLCAKLVGKEWTFYPPTFFQRHSPSPPRKFLIQYRWHGLNESHLPTSPKKIKIGAYWSRGLFQILNYHIINKDSYSVEFW